MASGIAGAEQADDIIHDAFCRLWSRHPLLNNDNEAARLTYTTVRNTAIDAYRSTRSKQAIGIEQIQISDIDAITDSSAADSDRELYDRIVAMSASILTPNQYRIFNLHDIQGIGYDEIAAEIGMTPVNVRMTLSRARKILREVFKNEKKY